MQGEADKGDGGEKVKKAPGQSRAGQGKLGQGRAGQNGAGQSAEGSISRFSCLRAMNSKSHRKELGRAVRSNVLALLHACGCGFSTAQLLDCMRRTQRVPREGWGSYLHIEVGLEGELPDVLQAQLNKD
ncbi:MAG: hypothetical protein FRX49_08481 [Trebouxia sp. A1-2]|nr:MAG: hypothetical protein FRX49_08481 [Trebouxia sp. A1-2]